jgi:hypothetical protein
MRLVTYVILAAAIGCGGDQEASTASTDGGASTTDAIAPSDSTNGTDTAATTPPGDAGSPSDASSVSDGALGPPADSGAPARACKRGLATNTAPSAALAPSTAGPGIGWWYDWSNQPSSGAAAGFDFVPMIWGTKSLGAAIPASSRFLLGFNEPNFKAQSNLTPAQAAQNWPSVETSAKALGIPIVSPAVNFCGSASNTSGCSDPAVTDPYTWLKKFFAACPGCTVDAIAVHWYNCDLPSLQAYIEGNASLEGFVQFGKPIWLTEFSCDGSQSAANQKAYMEAAVPWLEGNAHVARYAWFSATPIPNALVMAADGSLTDLGKTYVALAAPSCP